MLQAFAPGAEYWSGPQASHVLAPSPLNVPLGQIAQGMPMSAYLPGEHRVQLGDMNVEYDPAAQGEHTEEPASL